jgi:hypothetical protein
MEFVLFDSTTGTTRIRNISVTHCLLMDVCRRSKDIPVTGCGSLQGCEMLMILHCSDSRLTDGSELSSIITGRALLPRNIFLKNGVF